MSTRPKLFTIPSGANFTKELARGVVARFEHPENPFSIPDCLVFLPTRRAIRATEAAFAGLPGRAGIFLPRIKALGDWDTDDHERDDPAALTDQDLTPPPVDPLERALALMEMVLAWESKTALAAERPARDPSLAYGLAQDLSRLFDAAALERVDWSTLQTLVPPEMAEHWQVTLEFLQLITVEWPSWLAHTGRSDPGQFRDRQLHALAKQWTASPPTHPVIIAGSTGSVLATAELMKAVARMPLGAVILPGLDQSLDDHAWDVLGPDHPQFVLRHLLELLGADRSEVELWTDASGATDRAKLWSEVMRPAAASAAWSPFIASAKDDAPKMIRGLTVIETANPNEEALSIALVLREALERDDETAALITPDRNLARRVASELQRWGIVVDDSAGRPLSKTTLGAFLSMVAAAASGKFAPVETLSLLKHPFCMVNRKREDVRWLGVTLELDALRGPRPLPGLDGLRTALGPKAKREVLTLLDDLQSTFTPISDVQNGRCLLRDWAARHLAVAKSLAAAADPDDPWADEAGRSALTLFAELQRHDFLTSTLTFDGYARLFDRLMDGIPVRPQRPSDPRVSILGPLEARLQFADLVVLGGLNEPGSPAAANVDGWINRPMRRTMKFSQPERRIGQSAHDFVASACAPRVVLSRAAKEDGGLANPSRWLVRLKTIATALDVADKLYDTTVCDWVAQLDHPQKFVPGSPPDPRPPVSARPRKLSVTHIEQWVRDPYAHYIRRILNLKPLDAIDADPSAADRGNFIHRALELFVLRYPCNLPPDAETQLTMIGREVIAEMAVPPGVIAVWWPRYLRIAKWFVVNEHHRRDAIAQIWTEAQGTMTLEDVKFVLQGKADRIEIFKDGLVTILDYKTGKEPTQKEFDTGFSCQLPLEAVIAMSGGFPEVQAKGIAGLTVLKLTGKNDGGEEITYENVEVLMQKAIGGLRRRIHIFDKPETPYISRPHVKFARAQDDYTYIARAAERLLDEGASE